ncbi:MAG: haloalkane dehalogenase [Chloroflexi bacterium]|nr:haloalkane dehalogenase [Chloroflexota bacterium]MCZ6707956.1 haloalkane dehalogenase [Chloroflexota bacterium]
MPESDISASDPYERHSVSVLDSEMAYVDTGDSDSAEAVVFLHGNPTSSYLWRNIIPHVAPLARCLAVDLIGMGDSGKSGDGSYRFVDHRKYLDAWLDAVLPTQQLTFVIHDWGSALGFDWANRHRDRVKGLVYMEAIVTPLEWDEFPEGARGVFEGFRSEAGEDMVLEKNVFVESVLPGSILRTLTDEEHAVYRKPYAEPGEVRRPTLTWPREIPIAGEPADVVSIVKDYGEWLQTSEVAKLLVAAKPGAILNGRQLEFARSWPNQTEVTVEGVHFVQEDSPAAIGRAIAEWYPAI